ncbi:MAG: hypothetical protein JWQ04_3250, partial [Pedosphaera sp.]|nr:hypothetical protein [Pedosphaera sp.]
MTLFALPASPFVMMTHIQNQQQSSATRDPNPELGTRNPKLG